MIGKKITKSTFNKNVRIVHQLGEPNTAEIVYGKRRTTVNRQDKVLVIDKNNHTAEYVTCAPYDNFFVFLLPTDIEGWFAMCGCGGPAVIVGYDGYKKDASITDTGKMLICYHHANSGFHSDGST